MPRTTRRLTTDRATTGTRGVAGPKRSRLQLSLHLMMLSAATAGCAAPGRLPLPPSITASSSATTPLSVHRGTSDTAAAIGGDHQQELSSDPNALPGSHVIAASHVVPATEIALSRAQFTGPFQEPAEPGANGSDGNEAAGDSNGGPARPSERAAAPGAPAAQPVEYFIARALQSHPRIEAARLRVAAATQEIPQARALADPTWNNTFWPITDNALQTAGGRVAHQMSLSQQVPWPEKLRARAAIASREVEVARAELARIEREISEAVRLAYYELWYATEAIEVVEDNRELVSDLIAVAEIRYRTGGAQQDVLRAELEAERLEDQLIALRRQREVAQADLGALLQQPVGLAPQPVRELGLPSDVGQLDSLIGAALACNPELRGLAWQIARDRERERLACLQRYPDFQLGVGWSAITENQALSGVANGNDNLNFTVGVTLPVWREKINAGIREAAANTAATARTRDAEQDALYGTIRRLLAEADGLFQQLELYRTRIIPRTERTLQLATADYRSERVDFFSLIDIYQELLVYQVQVARMEANLAGTLAQLERAVGCPVDLTPHSL